MNVGTRILNQVILQREIVQLYFKEINSKIIYVGSVKNEEYKPEV